MDRIEEIKNSSEAGINYKEDVPFLIGEIDRLKMMLDAAASGQDATQKQWAADVAERDAVVERHTSTCMGWDVKDLIGVARMMETYDIKPEDFKALCHNLAWSYSKISEEIRKSASKSLDAVMAKFATPEPESIKDLFKNSVCKVTRL